MKLWHVVAFAFFAIVGAIFFAGFSFIRDPQLQLWVVENWWSPPPAPGSPDKVISIPPGANAAQIGDLLAEFDIVKEPQAFRFVAGRLGLGNNLQAGQYRLHGGMSLSEVASSLQHGAARLLTITVPEGKRTEESLALIAASKVATPEALAAAADPRSFTYDFLKDLPAGGTLDGYLFPDTYHTPPDFGAKATIDLFLKNFQDKVTPEIRAAARAQGLTLHEALVLASIVEREARVPSEQATIAGVFMNRIREQMPLAADPTVQYAVASNPLARLEFGWWKRDLTYDDLAVDSPYNTYRYPGLPPAPICNPGLAAIKAAVAPEKHDYLFFVARPDGSHAFAATFEEHSRNIALYQQ